ncbi:Crp/Fnr family transcriptional regulator [Caenimonas sp. SL110]|uniref:Crp/Fnr family transcriptional regulator n=1 Tax=Caenimonas sp. SL110 TaxID=1450524 RepID=UPI000652AD12|nr:cyclic nucleotide-binding domain-containing protein [Caenimonas sp. SL110]
MNAPLRTPLKFDLNGLIQAISHNRSNDAFNPQLTPAQWELLGGYLTPFALMEGQVLIEQGAVDRTLYLVESGTLSVHYKDGNERVRLAMVGAGSAVGEGAFFTRLARNATVQAAGPSKMWCLTPIRFTELSNRQPAVALEIAMALGSVVTRRLANKPKRVAVT